MKDLFFNPSAFFKKAKNEQDAGKALLVFIIFTTIGAFFSTILAITVFLLFSSFLVDILPEITVTPLHEIVISGLTDGILYPIVFLFLYVLLMLLSLYIFKTKTSYKELLILDAYATAPTLLYAWIPIFGWIGSLVHYVYLLIVAGKEFFGFETKDSIIRLFLVPIGFALAIGLLMILPIILLVIVVVALLGGIYFT